jgi:hypothetical protein
LMSILHRVSSSPSGPIDPSFRALSGRLKFTVRRHKFKEDSLSSCHPPNLTHLCRGTSLIGQRPSPLGPTQGPRHSPSVGSWERAVAYGRGTPVLHHQVANLRTVGQPE